MFRRNQSTMCSFEAEFSAQKLAWRPFCSCGVWVERRNFRGLAVSTVPQDFSRFCELSWTCKASTGSRGANTL